MSILSHMRLLSLQWQIDRQIAIADKILRLKKAFRIAGETADIPLDQCLEIQALIQRAIDEAQGELFVCPRTPKSALIPPTSVRLAKEEVLHAA